MFMVVSCINLIINNIVNGWVNLVIVKIIMVDDFGIFNKRIYIW